jgi:cell division transport system permease protein
MNSPISIALQRIKRSPYQTLAAVSIMTMTLFLASIFFLLAVGSQLVLRFFETRPQVNAFYNQETVPLPQEVELIRADLESTGLVENFKYVSKEEALQVYKELNKNDPLLI